MRVLDRNDGELGRTSLYSETDEEEVPCGAAFHLREAVLEARSRPGDLPVPITGPTAGGEGWTATPRGSCSAGRARARVGGRMRARASAELDASLTRRSDDLVSARA